MIFKQLFKTVVLLLTATVIVACGDSDDGWSPWESRAELEDQIVGHDQTKLTGYTYGDPRYKYEAIIVEGNEWCSFSKNSADSSTNGIVGETFTLYLSVNTGEDNRSAAILVKYNGGKYSTLLEFEQLAMSQNTSYDRTWGEQPAMKEADNFIYKTYYTTVNGKRVRNYSICYDTDKLVSQWVAYPVHQFYEYKGTGRTDLWAFDDTVWTGSPGNWSSEYIPTYPVIDKSLQQDIENGAYGTGDSRGHMLPSASRLVTVMANAQTFYATNMMPQNSKFNSGSWVKVEGWVRDNKCSDTLFVITGTLFDTSNPNCRVFTSKGRTITRPSHAYKLMLRTRSGSTGKNIKDIKSADEIKAIGFLFENSTAGNSEPRNAVVSIAEIEAKTGFTFYRNLDPAIADKVKSQKNFNDWNF
ncbi:MAG: DNA/RNA non-specific endonuclease [Alistipes sp.]|nr:DNA/RNA non-specific endonuclease [Alistipes sp.]